MTDLLGVLEEWGETTITVRHRDGGVVVIDRRDIVSGKPVPPRPSVRLRLPPEQVALRAASTWPAMSTARVGDWLLRAADGFTLRANSALLVGDPGRPWDEALAEVERFYGRHGLPVRAQALTGTRAQLRLQEAGWSDVRPGMREVDVRVAGVASALRAAREAGRAGGGGPGDASAPVVLGDRVSDAWLASDPRALAHRRAAVAVLEGPALVAFASVVAGGGAVVAKGRAALSEEADVWVGLSDLWVAPEHRRHGHARAVMAALLEWAAERGATTAYLQVTGDNHPATALYEALGFVTHHTYRYLGPAG